MKSTYTEQQRAIRVWARRLVSTMVLTCLLFVPQLHTQTNEAVVYLDSSLQVIKGFGAANIRPWRADMTPDEIQTAFGTGPGQIGFTILRLRVPSNANEFTLNVPTAQAAYGMGVKIIASPWSPPAWMKQNNNVNGDGTGVPNPNSLNRLYDTSYASYAAHLKSFADFMASNGVPLYAISVQNEPDWNPGYEACVWNASEMLKFMKENAPAIGIPVFLPEAAGFSRTLSDPILNDSVAASHVSFIGGHIYGGGRTPYPLAAEKGKELWMTEYLINSPGSGPDMDISWKGAMSTARSIHDVMNVGMSAYVWWYIVRYYGPISDGEPPAGGALKGTVTKKGYVMSQYARFVRPGYTRVFATVPDPRAPFYLTAYKSGSKVVIVALNSGSSSVEQPISIQNIPGTITSLTPYVTSKTKNCEQGNAITVSNDSFTATLADSSITTFVADVVSDVEEHSTVPQTFELFQNYPNPFNPETVISYQLPVDSWVTLKVYNPLGQEIASLVNNNVGVGVHRIPWDATNFPSGVYFYRLDAGSFSQTKKLLLLK